ncbi:MAG: cytochrome C [Bdellovibrio sp.]|nr:MAG: cytochrome C [Bdellovibrio sp.]
MVAAIAGVAFADEPTLQIRAGDEVLTFSRRDLLNRPDAVTIEIPQNPLYPGRTTTVRAVPVAALFRDVAIPPKATITFHCVDSFAAPISKQRLLNISSAGAVAYITIEQENEKWPPMKAEKGEDPKTPAPFYLAWLNPEKSKIGPEEWPYQLASFSVTLPIEEQYPLIVPSAKLGSDHPIQLGFKTFLKNCFACHTMNGQGATQMGPDLNLPYNPTQYLREDYLKKLIRNPQQLRHWPQAKMNGFTREQISEDELRDLILYLKHMARHKAR